MEGTTSKSLVMLINRRRSQCLQKAVNPNLEVNLLAIHA